MKGKNDRMAFAATENAKVCTSVRMRYCTVEKTRFGGRRVRRSLRGGSSSCLAEAEIAGFDTVKLHPTLAVSRVSETGRTIGFGVLLPFYCFDTVKIIII